MKAASTPNALRAQMTGHVEIEPRESIKQTTQPVFF